MATDDAAARAEQIRARLGEIDERWWGVHTSYEVNPDGSDGRAIYGRAHRHAGEDIGYLLEQARALLAERDALLARCAAAEARAERDAARLAALAFWEKAECGWRAVLAERQRTHDRSPNNTEYEYWRRMLLKAKEELWAVLAAQRDAAPAEED